MVEEPNHGSRSWVRNGSHTICMAGANPKGPEFSSFLLDSAYREPLKKTEKAGTMRDVVVLSVLESAHPRPLCHLFNSPVAQIG